MTVACRKKTTKLIVFGHLGSYHFHQWQIEKYPCGHREDPLLHFCLGGHKKSSVEAEKGCQSAEEVHQHSSFYWEPRAK